MRFAPGAADTQASAGRGGKAISLPSAAWRSSRIVDAGQQAHDGLQAVACGAVALHGSMFELSQPFKRARAWKCLDPDLVSFW